MTKLTTYSKTGSKSDDFKLPKDYTEKPNLYLLAQAIRVYEDSLHPGLSKVKTRGEVRLSTRKIYRQKGTGGARHGAKSAPIFVGGGVAHGPKGLKHKLSLSRDLRKKALQSAFSYSLMQDKIVILSGLGAIQSTNEMGKLLKTIESKSGVHVNSNTVVINDSEAESVRFLRNLKNVNVILDSNLNAHQIYFGGLILFSKKAFAKLFTEEKEKPAQTIKKIEKTSAIKKSVSIKKPQSKIVVKKSSLKKPVRKPKK